MDLTSYPRTPRLVNRFKLGSDPEFTFISKGGEYMYAENCGLTTLQAFGCDMAGRQAELRAYPSRFALEVVASMVDTLRWMSWAHGAYIGEFTWTAAAYNGKDGCGGHIHFGRRRWDRNLDVSILDDTTQVLLKAKVLDPLSFRNRQAKTHYGRLGDMRLQSHGFEYRTLPTAMSNPWLTYFVLVINKLTVYRAERIPHYSVLPTTDWFMSLLKKYEDVDDDAAIALKAVKLFGLPVDIASDFKDRWGVPIRPPFSRDLHKIFFPSIIEPEDTTCLELFALFTQGIPLPKRMPSPTWEPLNLPEGFYRVSVQPHTLGHLPDVGMNLISKGLNVRVEVSDHFKIQGHISLPFKEIKKALLPNVDRVFIYPDTSRDLVISVPKGFKDSLTQCRFLHQVLSNSSLFPVCKAKNFNSTDWSRWDVSVTVTSKAKLGKVIAQAEGKKVPEPVPVPVITVKKAVARKPLRRRPDIYNLNIDEGGF